MTDPYEVPYLIDKKNDFKMSLEEVRNQMNITIDFMLQMPEAQKHLLLDYNIRFYEDLSAYKSRIRISN